MGGLGLALVAFLDSSFLSLPEVTDVGIFVLVLQHPTRWFYYALMSTAGSVAGCYVLYVLAKKGGEAFLRKRVKEHHIASTMGAFRRHGLLALVVPSILPPPMPFKIFVLLAGVSEVPTSSFLGAMLIGRGFRYGIEAFLTRLYGERAQRFITENLGRISVWAAVLVAVGGVTYTIWRRNRGRRSPGSSGPGQQASS